MTLQNTSDPSAMELIHAIVEGMQERKAQDIVHVDISAVEYAATNHFVICTGNSSMQVESIADSIRDFVERTTGQRPFNYDGYRNAQWIVIDYGTIYAHVFVPEWRERYNLEELWSDTTLTRYATDQPIAEQI